jgi:sensor histidine kinase regulating citrate/malate metabolism
VEASEEWGEVEVGSTYNDGYVDIWVKNKSVIPAEIVPKLFRQPVSTKGKNRGIGTYSMKILTEEYLKGKVSYESCEENGTKFVVKLPPYIKKTSAEKVEN